MEVQLWADAVGFLSSWTACRLAGLRKMPATTIHYTVPPTFRRRAPDGVHLDRSFWFHPSRDRVHRDDGLIVATPARMLWGYAADRPRRFATAAEDAWHRGLCTPSELAEYLEEHRCRGKAGVAAIESWLTEAAHIERPAQSGLEQSVLDAIEDVGLPTPVRQHRLVLASSEVIHLDLAWPEIRLAVEPGASWFHGGDAGQHRDHQRDLACAEKGWQIIRLDERFRSDLAGAARSIARAYRCRLAAHTTRPNTAP